MGAMRQHIVRAGPLVNRGSVSIPNADLRLLFDTSKIKIELGWSPTLDNSQMLAKAYDY